MATGALLIYSTATQPWLDILYIITWSDNSLRPKIMVEWLVGNKVNNLFE